MSSPPTSYERRTHKLLEQLLPDKLRSRLLLAAVGIIGSLVVGTYGINFMFGPLNLGVLEFIWGALLAVGGIAGFFTSVVILIPALLATASERLTDDETISTANDDPVESLKRRYAEGKVDDEEFERRLDRLLQSPDGDGGRNRIETEGPTADRDHEMAYDH